MQRQRRPVVLAAGLACLALLVMLIPGATASGPRLLGVLNVPPVGVNDSYTAAFETRLDIDTPGVLANDIDLDGDRLFTVLVTDTTHGVLRLDKDGKVRYTPDHGFSGVDHFTYRPFDGASEALLAVTVTITVKPKTPPKATPTPQPTPVPTATPAPTPVVTPAPTPVATPIPTLVLPTLPVIIPLPTRILPTPPASTPLPTATPAPTPVATPTTSPAPGSTARPSSGPSDSPDASDDARPSATSGVAVVIGAGTGTGGGEGPAGQDHAATILTPGRSDDGTFSFTTFGDVGGGIEWVVPSVLVTVPGFVLIAVGLAQLFGGFLWLPLARRWLRGDGRRTALANLSRPR